jgi:COP9 signalosome complex subunit 1
LAIQEAKKGSDVQNFYDALGLLQQIPNVKDMERLADPAWAKEQEKKNLSDTHKLENELKGYKNNLIKESIRVRLLLFPLMFKD